MSKHVWIFVGFVLSGGVLGIVAHGSPRNHREPSTQWFRSKIIFPEQKIALRMNHSHPAHRALRCVQCHVRAGTSENSADRLVPDEQACKSCHAQQTHRETASQEHCGFCHVGYDEHDSIAPRSEFPEPRIHFSHNRHVRVGMKCLDCHEGITEATLGTRSHLPTMRLCLRCHAPDLASLQQFAFASKPLRLPCNACHIAWPTGRLRTHYQEGDMNPPPWMYGMHHDQDWITRHRWVGADHGGICSSCHEERECVNCHDGRVRSPRTHPNDWLTIHSQMARRDQPRCSSCHAVQTFCAECHARLGIATIAPSDIRTTERYHPPPDVWVTGRALHAREAERSMWTCTSCHSETDCTQCHGEVGIGSGISPHAADFVNHCSAQLSQNSRACRMCHANLESLATRCR